MKVSTCRQTHEAQSYVSLKLITKSQGNDCIEAYLLQAIQRAALKTTANCKSVAEQSL